MFEVLSKNGVNRWNYRLLQAGKKEKDESSAFGADNQDIPADLLSCLDNFIFLTQKFTGTPDYMKEILLHWAKTDAVFIPNGVQNDIFG